MQAWEVKVIRCRRKTIGIRVTDDGEVIVRAPTRTPMTEIRRVLEEKRGWIEKTLIRVRTREQVPKLTGEEVEALAQQALKDPYCFDFLTLRERYTKHELEDALVGNITRFLLELGSGFSFVGRQWPWRLTAKSFSSTCFSITSNCVDTW